MPVAGLFISMRALSKYWTTRWPPGASTYGSQPMKKVFGPQVHERVVCWAATGRS